MVRCVYEYKFERWISIHPKRRQNTVGHANLNSSPVHSIHLSFHQSDLSLCLSSSWWARTFPLGSPWVSCFPRLPLCGCAGCCCWTSCWSPPPACTFRWAQSPVPSGRSARTPGFAWRLGRTRTPRCRGRGSGRDRGRDRGSPRTRQSPSGSGNRGRVGRVRGFQDEGKLWHAICYTFIIVRHHCFVIADGEAANVAVVVISAAAAAYLVLPRAEVLQTCGPQHVLLHKLAGVCHVHNLLPILTRALEKK